MNSTNSGVQYRSTHLPPGTAGVIGKWVLKGYQADIDFANQYTGMLYEERGRGFLAPRGTFGYVGPNQPAHRPGQTPPTPRPVRRRSVRAVNWRPSRTATRSRHYIKLNDWNQFQVIARGNVLMHIINGHVTALFVDDDAATRATKGLLGFQMHVGPPMKIEFRNIWLKTL